MRLKSLLLLMCVSVSGLLLAQNNEVLIVNNTNGQTAKKAVTQAAYLGVKYSHISKEKAAKLNFPNKNGVYVTRIIQGTAAEKVGIKAFDYLIGMNGQQFTESMTFSRMMDNIKPNETATIELIRKGQPMTISTTLTTKPEKIKNLYTGKYAFLGVSPSHNKLPKGIEGTRVSEIEPNSTAKAMGMKPNDIVQFVNDNPILEWHDLNTAMKNTAKGEDLKVVFYREKDGQTRTKTMKAVRHGDFVDVPILESESESETESESDSKIAVVEMENVSEAESEEMAEADIDMPVINTLAVENLRLFPNPNNGIFNLNFNLDGTDKVNIRVFSANGTVIYEDNLGEFSGEYLEQINISDNAKGVYFLQVRQGKNVLSKKIILK